MNETQILDWCQATGLAQLVRQVQWLFATCETIHFIGLSLLLGSLLLVDLRLLGALRRIPIRYVLPFTNVAAFGFFLNVISGVAMFVSNPYMYWPNPAFKLKMALIVVAGLNLLWFELAERKKVTTLPDDSNTGPDTKLVAFLSLTLWFSIIALGRLLPTFEGATSFF